MSHEANIVFREEPVSGDLERVRRIIEGSGFFHPYEVTVAVEVVNERLLKGLESGYYFLFAEVNGEVAGYACYGPVPCTEASYDIYWIAVRNDLRHHGSGKRSRIAWRPPSEKWAEGASTWRHPPATSTRLRGPSTGGSD